MSNALSEAATEADVKLAFELFEGIVVTDKKGLPTQRFLTEAQETRRREAIARLLRSDEPLDKSLRILLAGHFDGRPYGYSARAEPYMAPKRRLVFKSPRGNRREDQRLFKIGAEVLRLLDEDPALEVKQAIDKTVIKYKMSEDRVTDAWEYINRRGWKRKQYRPPLKLPPVK
jgi:hypothetical protein